MKLETTELSDGNEGAIIRMVNAVFIQATRDKATDIHIVPVHPNKPEFIIRFCIQGVFEDVLHPPQRLLVPFVERIKQMVPMEEENNGIIFIQIQGVKFKFYVKTKDTLLGEQVEIKIAEENW